MSLYSELVRRFYASDNSEWISSFLAVAVPDIATLDLFSKEAAFLFS